MRSKAASTSSAERLWAAIFCKFHSIHLNDLDGITPHHTTICFSYPGDNVALRAVNPIQRKKNIARNRPLVQHTACKSQLRLTLLEKSWMAASISQP